MIAAMISRMGVFRREEQKQDCFASPVQSLAQTEIRKQE